MMLSICLRNFEDILPAAFSEMCSCGFLIQTLNLLKKSGAEHLPNPPEFFSSELTALFLWFIIEVAKLLNSIYAQGGPYYVERDKNPL